MVEGLIRKKPGTCGKSKHYSYNIAIPWLAIGLKENPQRVYSTGSVGSAVLGHVS